MIRKPFKTYTLLVLSYIESELQKAQNGCVVPCIIDWFIAVSQLSWICSAFGSFIIPYNTFICSEYMLHHGSQLAQHDIVQYNMTLFHCFSNIWDVERWSQVLCYFRRNIRFVGWSSTKFVFRSNRKSKITA